MQGVTATPEYVLSLIEKAQASANEFAAVFSLFVEQQLGDDHVNVIKCANQLAQAASDSVVNVKGILRFCRNEDAMERLTSVAVDAGHVLLRFFLNVQSYRLASMSAQQRSHVAMQQNAQANDCLLYTSPSPRDRG